MWNKKIPVTLETIPMSAVLLNLDWKLIGSHLQTIPIKKNLKRHFVEGRKMDNFVKVA